MVSAISYARSSSANIKSIQDQLSDNETVAQQQNWRLVTQLSDKVSASTYGRKPRENWAQIWTLLPKIDIIILWEPSRGDRDNTEWSRFLDSCRVHNVRIHATSHNRTYDLENPRDLRSLREDGVDAAYESDKLSSRVRRGVASSAADGKPHGKLTYGYVRIKDQTTGKFARQDIHPEHAQIVKRIFYSLRSGETITAIAKSLNDDGIPTPRDGRIWYSSTVRDIARNVAYRGIRVHKGVSHTARWEPIIDEVLWLKVQKILGTNDETVRQQRKYSTPKYLLSGSQHLLTCQECHGTISATTSGDGIKYYSCQENYCSGAPMAEVDDYVTRLIITRLSKKDIRKLWVEDHNSEAEEELERLTAIYNESLDLFKADKLSPTAFSVKEQQLLPAIEAARRATQTADMPHGVVELMDAANVATERIWPVWRGFGVATRRAVAQWVFTDLTLCKSAERLSRWMPKEQRLVIVSNRINHTFRGKR